MAGSVRHLLERFPRMGRIEWIGVRPGRRVPMRALEGARLLAGRGIEGDRYASRGGRGDRQVTLIQAEHLDVVARLMGRRRVDPALLRRNLVVSGVNLVALAYARFRVGGALLEGVGPCEPCSRMEEALGRGGYNAMRGHGGIVARILDGARTRVGDAVVYLSPRIARPGDPP